MSTTVFIPRDSSAASMGSDDVAHQLSREAHQLGVELRIVRNGSPPLFWLEPMIEVETPAGRVAYGPVRPEDAASFFEPEFLLSGEHRLRLGPTEDIPYLKNQERLTFPRGG